MLARINIYININVVPHREHIVFPLKRPIG
jgi:hypothetical protein